jgi:hypothetical protein
MRPDAPFREALWCLGQFRLEAANAKPDQRLRLGRRASSSLEGWDRHMLQCRGWPRNRAATGAESAPGLRAGWQHQVSLSDRYPIGPWPTGPFAPMRCSTKARTQRPPRATQLSPDRRTGTASEDLPGGKPEGRRGEKDRIVGLATVHRRRPDWVRSRRLGVRECQ